jgi:hypothetical protein
MFISAEKLVYSNIFCDLKAAMGLYTRIENV